MKLRTLFSILSILICSVQVTAQHANQTHDANRARAVALWEEVIRAKGGRERLQAVENVLIVSKVNSSTLPQFNPRATRRLFVLPDRAWLQGSVHGSQGNMEVVVTSIKQRLCHEAISNRTCVATTSCLLISGVEFVSDEGSYDLFAGNQMDSTSHFAS